MLRVQHDKHRGEQRDLPVQAKIGTPGMHTWPYWQRELHHAWPLLAQNFHITTAQT